MTRARATTTAGGAGADLRENKLATVRALLAKAESTAFPEEARALTAKAQELMARHALTEAQLETIGEKGRDAIVVAVVEVEAPYRNAKGLLLTRVAEANRCQVIQADASHGSEFHLTGYATDADRVQLLFTSLLVQAVREMLGTEADPWINTRAFRHAFLIGYASEIGDRLASSAEATVEEHRRDTGTDLLPVLADRAEHVQREVERQWGGTLRSSRISYRPGAGYTAGQRAGRRADLADRRLRGRQALTK